jgi:hypothetical protein
MSEEEENGSTEHRMYGSIGSLELTVKGQDADWVAEQFDEKLDRLLEESEDISTALRDGTRSCQ